MACRCRLAGDVVMPRLAVGWWRGGHQPAVRSCPSHHQRWGRLLHVVEACYSLSCCWLVGMAATAATSQRWAGVTGLQPISSLASCWLMGPTSQQST